MAHCILVTNHQKSQKWSSGFCSEQVPKYTILGSRVLGPPNGRRLDIIRSATIVWRIHCASIVATRTSVFTVALLLVGWDFIALHWLYEICFFEDLTQTYASQTKVKRRKYISEYSYGDFEVCWWSNLIHIPFSAVRSSFINLLFS